MFRDGKIWLSQIMPFNNYSFHLMKSVLYLDDILIIFGDHDIHKKQFCFHESIFQWQINLISHQSEFRHIRRKPAVIFSEWIFFQNSLEMSWAILSGKMQVEKINTISEFSLTNFWYYFCDIYMCSDYNCQSYPV